MGLEEVLSFLSQNALEGVLTVQSGDEATLRLYFQEGRVFFPFSARRGTYSLGKVLRHTGVLSRESLETYMAEARKKKAALLQSAADAAKVEEAQRLQSTEEIHDLFLWGNAHFEFLPGPMPPRIQQDMGAGRGLMLDVQGLLMEVAHRQDERRRIRAAIPSSRVILRTIPGSEKKILDALQAARIDVTKSPFDGALRIDDLLVRWGVPHHDALKVVGILVEEGRLGLLPVDQARRFGQACLDAGDLSGAARFIGHALELEPGPRGVGGPEHHLIVAKPFREGPEASASLRLPGPRVFLLAQELLLQGTQFTLVARVSGQELKLSALPGEVSLQGGPVKIEDVLLQLKYVTQAQVDEARAPSIPGFDRPQPVVELITPEQRVAATLELLVQSLGEAALWQSVEVELKNRRQAFPSATSLSASLSDDVRGKVVKALAVMGAVLARVSGEDAIFVPGPRSKSGDPAARFFQRFALERNVSELRRAAQVARLEFLRFVSRGLDKGYVRPATEAELRAAFDAARAKKNDVHAARLARAAAALGHGDAMLRAIGQGVGAGQVVVDGAAIQGDLEGVGLAAVLQALRDHKHTGTLVITAGKREEKLYFNRGDVFILRFEDAEGAAFAQFFLGDEGTEQMSDLLGNVEEASAGGIVSESQLSQDEVREIKAGFLDILFWEGATFGFFQNDLPEEFFSPGKNVTEIALETDRFLLDAIRALTEWDAIRRVVPTGRTVFRFPALDRKLAAIREHGHPEILTLVDGRQSFDGIVRISGERRLVVGRLVRALVEAGSLEAAGAVTPAQAGARPTHRRAPDLDAEASAATIEPMVPTAAALDVATPPAPGATPSTTKFGDTGVSTLDDAFDSLSGGEA